MFNTLTDRLGQILNKIKGRGILTQEMVDEAMREIKIALLEADVALPVVKSFINTVKEQAVGQNIIKSVQPAQQVVKIVHDALVQTLDDGDSACRFADGFADGRLARFRENDLFCQVGRSFEKRRQKGIDGVFGYLPPGRTGTIGRTRHTNRR